jgi:hypothetical protein
MGLIQGTCNAFINPHNIINATKSYSPAVIFFDDCYGYYCKVSVAITIFSKPKNFWEDASL